MKPLQSRLKTEGQSGNALSILYKVQSLSLLLFVAHNTNSEGQNFILKSSSKFLNESVNINPKFSNVLLFAVLVLCNDSVASV